MPPRADAHQPSRPISGTKPSAHDDQGLCSVGVVYATFGPQTRKFLDDALAEEAACGGVVPHCEGNVALRCPSASEGSRAITKVDCGLLGLACAVDGSGVACVDPPSSTPDAGRPDAGDAGTWYPTDARAPDASDAGTGSASDAGRD